MSPTVHPQQHPLPRTLAVVGGAVLSLLIAAIGSAWGQARPAPAPAPPGQQTPAPDTKSEPGPADDAAHGVVHPPPTGDEGGVVPPPKTGAGNGATPVIPPPGTESSPNQGVDPR